MSQQDFSRRRALALAEALRVRVGTDKNIAGAGGLTEELAQALEVEFASIAISALGGKAAQDGRGSVAYWRDHGALTAELMMRAARRWGGNVDLYGRVGRLHDVDYLSFPHDGGGTKGDRHPVPLVRAMRDRGVHPAICLAILEHAPYVGLDEAPTSRLSATLSATEDLATIVALEPPLEAPEELSMEARSLVVGVEPLEFIYRKARVRVETDIPRYVNRPLAKVVEGGPFPFDV